MSSILLEEHPKTFRANPLATTLGVVLIPAIVGIVILLVLYLKSIGEKLVVTRDTLMVEKGILNKDRTEMSLTGIRSVNVKQSFYERIVGIGTISMYTTGDEPESVISGIKDPHRVRAIINQTMREGAPAA